MTLAVNRHGAHVSTSDPVVNNAANYMLLPASDSVAGVGDEARMSVLSGASVTVEFRVGRSYARLVAGLDTFPTDAAALRAARTLAVRAATRMRR